MATEQPYTIEQAIGDLEQAGLLHSILLPNGSGMDSVTLATIRPQTVGATFQGAGLDSRDLSGTALFVALAGENVDGRDYAASALSEGNWVLTRTMNQGQDDPLLAANGAPDSGVLLCAEPELALAHLAGCYRRRLAVEVVGVTGTNGKTTTKDFIRAMLGAAGKTQATPGNLNNQLGLPLTLLNLQHDTKYAVIEMGASAVGDIRFLAEITHPKVGIITNAAPAHLAHFGSLENIIDGKGELLAALPSDGTAVLNADSPGYERWQEKASCPVVSWGIETGDHHWSWLASETSPGGHLLLGDESWPVPLPGRHNAANLCAAILACRALGIGDDILRRGLQDFAASDHRGKLLSWEERLILDDTYNANPVSMLAAVNSLAELAGDGRTIAVLGTMAELGTGSDEIHEETGKDLGVGPLDILLAVGENAFGLADGFSGTEAGVAHKIIGHQEAVDWLILNSAPGDRILIKGSRSSSMETIIQKLGLNET